MPSKKRLTVRKHGGTKKGPRKRKQSSPAKSGASAAGRSDGKVATQPPHAAGTYAKLPAPLVDRVLDYLSIAAPGDNVGMAEAVKKAAAMEVSVRVDPKKLSQREQRIAKRARREEQKRLVLQARKQFDDSRKHGRPPDAQEQRRVKGSSRDIAESLNLDPRKVALWISKSKPTTNDADEMSALEAAQVLEDGDADESQDESAQLRPAPAAKGASEGQIERRGGHNRRISRELFSVLFCFVAARQEDHTLTERRDIADWCVWLECVCPELRSRAAVKEAELAAKEGKPAPPPKPGVISALCKLLGISRQRSRAIKPQRLRETAEEEVRLYRFNVNHWRLPQLWVQDETMGRLWKNPQFGLAVVNSGGLYIEGEERGPAATIVIMFNGG
jgi:hypothetical protein